MGEPLSFDQLRVRDRLKSGMWYSGYGDLVPMAETAPEDWHADDRISEYAKHILDWMCRREHIFDPVEPRTLGALLMRASVFEEEAVLLAESYTVDALDELRRAGYLAGPPLDEWDISSSWKLIWTTRTRPPTPVVDDTNHVS